MADPRSPPSACPAASRRRQAQRVPSRPTCLALASVCAATATLASSRTSSCRVGGAGQESGEAKQVSAAYGTHLATATCLRTGCSAPRQPQPNNQLAMQPPSGGGGSSSTATRANHLRQLHHLLLLLDRHHQRVRAQHARHAAKQQQRARHAAPLAPHVGACRRSAGAAAGETISRATAGARSPPSLAPAQGEHLPSTEPRGEGRRAGAPRSMSTECPPMPRWLPDTCRKMAAGRMKAMSVEAVDPASPNTNSTLGSSTASEKDAPARG